MNTARTIDIHEIEKEIGENLTLTDLIEPEILQKTQDSFSDLVGMAALTTDADGIAVTKGSNFSEFCTVFCRQSKVGLKRCEECDRQGAMMALEWKKPVSYACHAGLVDFAAPIMLGDRMIGSFVGGQVLSKEPDLKKMREIAREIGVDEEAFAAAAKKTKIVPQTDIEKATHFIYEFASVLSDMAYKALVSKMLGKKALEAATQKADFLANMSHEIRTPMNAVMGLSEIALREDMPDNVRTYIEQIQSAGKNLLVIINDILDYSKIESGQLNILSVNYQPTSLVSDLVNIVNRRIDDKQIEFLVDYSIDIPQTVKGDKVRVHQILLNLLINAVKFTSEGYVKLKMYHEKVNDTTILLHADIIDTGIGIAEKDIDSLFQSFSQIDSTRSREQEGTGLGLAITKQLLGLMQGTIKVTSVLGKGSTFSITIPQTIVDSGMEGVMPAAPTAISCLLDSGYVSAQLKADIFRVGRGLVEYREVKSVSECDAPYCIVDGKFFDENAIQFFKEHPSVKGYVLVPFDFKGRFSIPNVEMLYKPVYSKTLMNILGLVIKREEKKKVDNTFTFTAPDVKILVVDDNRINLVVATKTIEPIGMQIDTALSGMEAIAKAKEKQYDAILMDHMMPEMDGVEATHRIREEIPAYKNIPIIALTANVAPGVKEMFLEEGLDDFAPKPIRTKDMVKLLAKWLPKEKLRMMEET